MHINVEVQTTVVERYSLSEDQVKTLILKALGLKAGEIIFETHDHCDYINKAVVIVSRTTQSAEAIKHAEN